MLSKVMPLDEAETSATRLYKAKTFLEANSIDGEIAVTDNGSADDSRQIALRQGVRAVDTCERGYDSAGLSGVEACRHWQRGVSKKFTSGAVARPSFRPVRGDRRFIILRSRITLGGPSDGSEGTRPCLRH
jgi:hypothetical protein